MNHEIYGNYIIRLVQSYVSWQFNHINALLCYFKLRENLDYILVFGELRVFFYLFFLTNSKFPRKTPPYR